MTALTPRPTLSDRQKLTIMARYCRCPGVPEMGIACNKHLPTMRECEFDHIHARVLGGADTLDNFRPLCPACHSIKTNGVPATTAGSDKARAGKVRRLSSAQEEYRRMLLEKEPGQPRLKSGKIPCRPFARQKRELAR